MIKKIINIWDNIINQCDDSKSINLFTFEAIYMIITLISALLLWGNIEGYFIDNLITFICTTNTFILAIDLILTVHAMLLLIILIYIVITNIIKFYLKYLCKINLIIAYTILSTLILYLIGTTTKYLVGCV